MYTEGSAHTEGRMKVLKRSPRGGFLKATIETVHSPGCPARPMAKNLGPCKCGAHELAAQWTIAQGLDNPFASIKPF